MQDLLFKDTKNDTISYKTLFPLIVNIFFHKKNQISSYILFNNLKLLKKYRIQSYEQIL